MNKQPSLRIGLIAGEASGDMLGAGLIRELKRLYPDATFEGIGGKHMRAEGLDSKHDMEALSIMGLVEVIKHFPKLLKLRKSIIEHFLDNPPDVFIGVDAPDFNLGVESRLKAAGIKTVHYVAPTVWAWRESRIHKIADATNLVLGIFPFEKPTFDKYSVAYQYVGHTMADSIELSPDVDEYKQKLEVAPNSHVLAILPGSRAKEVSSLLKIFVNAAELLAETIPNLKVLIPAANVHRKEQINRILQALDSSLDIEVSELPARYIMLASDAVLLASGTASLEAMLCKKPMVVAYKMSALTYVMMKKLYKPDYFALPNILAQEKMVAELLQDEVNPHNIATKLRYLLSVSYQKNVLPSLTAKYQALHKALKLNADVKAAQSVMGLIQ